MDWGWAAIIVVGFGLGTLALCLLPPVPSRYSSVPVEKLYMVEPEDQDDMFCTCPKCYWLGNHAVEVAYRSGMRTIVHENGDVTELSSWAGPRPGWRAQRTCSSCGYTWETSAIEPKGSK